MTFEYQAVEDALVSFIKDRVSGRRVAVACSGGLDSGLVSAIAKEYAESVTLYTCGTENAFDVQMAKDLSKKLDLPFVHASISKASVENYIRELISATGTSDPFTISYELQLFCVCRKAEEEIVLTGQGADEYFMGCAKFVGASKEDYEVLKDSSVERLLEISVPCEKDIAKHFGKTLAYPYLESSVVSEVSKLDPEKLRPTDMDSRKQVLKDIAIHLGYPFLAERRKKSSQYGSGTTDLVRAIAREKNLMYNEYIAHLYGDVALGKITSFRGCVINARVDPVVKVKAERILAENGYSASEAIEELYRRIIEAGDISILRRG